MKNALTFGDYNPVHDGHVLGFKACLRVADRLDIYVGRKPKAHLLPREIRMEAMDVALAAAGIQEKARQINPERLIDINPRDYGALMMGSDVANFLVSPSRFEAFERGYFKSFGHIVVVQRGISPLTQDGEAALRKLGGLDVLDPVSESEARAIRDSWKSGGDIEETLDAGVWKVIEPHIEVWHLG